MLLLGDATGHGIGPALSVTQVRAMLRMAVRLGAGLDESFRHINDQLADDLSSNRFVTAFLGVLDTTTHQLTYHAGGQGPILQFHAARSAATLESATTLPMGMMTIFKPTKSRVALMEPGDVVAAITDGIYEYENAAGKMFGEQRVVDLVRQEVGSSAQKLLTRIVDEVTAFADGSRQLAAGDAFHLVELVIGVLGVVVEEDERLHVRVACDLDGGVPGAVPPTLAQRFVLRLHVRGVVDEVVGPTAELDEGAIDRVGPVLVIGGEDHPSIPVRDAVRHRSIGMRKRH
jgi:hypothetical protein